jgi:hypothetical protein
MDFIFNARRVSTGFFKNCLNNKFLIAFNSSRFLMASIGVSCIRTNSFSRSVSGRPLSELGGRNTYKLFLLPLGYSRMKKGPSPSGGTGISAAIVLLDFVRVNMEAGERRKTIVTVWSSPPRYAWQVVGCRFDLAYFAPIVRRVQIPRGCDIRPRRQCAYLVCRMDHGKKLNSERIHDSTAPWANCGKPVDRRFLTPRLARPFSQ